VIIGLIKVTSFLLDRQIRALERAFVENGGIREAMFRARLKSTREICGSIVTMKVPSVVFVISVLIAAFTPRAESQNEPPDFEITPQERSATIEGSITKLNEMYVFPKPAKKMEEAIRARASKR
jgi:four helix bundle suffix protein